DWSSDVCSSDLDRTVRCRCLKRLVHLLDVPCFVFRQKSTCAIDLDLVHMPEDIRRGLCYHLPGQCEVGRHGGPDIILKNPGQSFAENFARVVDLPMLVFKLADKVNGTNRIVELTGEGPG